MKPTSQTWRDYIDCDEVAEMRKVERGIQNCLLDMLKFSLRHPQNGLDTRPEPVVP